MPTRLPISRRDFLGGVALATTAGALSPLELLAAQASAGQNYPPSLTGLRGSQPGSFDVAHSVAWSQTPYPTPREQTDTDYDLVVVGGGISGLSAALFWRQAKGPQARILILDNHDDFGGHARRNEFSVDGQLLVGYGGSQSIDTPKAYSKAASQLLKDAGIVTERFYDYFDRDFQSRHGLGRGVYFSRKHYGSDSTLPWIDSWRGSTDATLSAEEVAAYPLDELSKSSLLGLMNNTKNYLKDIPTAQRPEWLRRRSYRDYLLQTIGVTEDVYLLFRDSIRGWWGVGWDAISALEAANLGMPGTQHLELPEIAREEPERDEPYIFHFPDGNAGVARSILRRLIPSAVPGSSMEDLVLARTDYSRLDRKDSACRLRLNSTAVEVRHSADQKWVDTTYIRDGKAYRVRSRHTVMACYNAILPHICPEMPQIQRDALDYATKVPLVYVSVAVRNWKPFAELGMSDISIVQPEFMHSFGLDFPVSMGGIDFTDSPEQPTVLHGTAIPCAPDQGYTSREQHVLGRRRLYEMTWDNMEAAITSQLDGALGKAGFEFDRDVAAITANRWPHGYAYEYNDLSDPPEYGPNNGPHILGAQQLGRISVANSDAAAYAFVDGAIDAARRAIDEQLT